jgi:hypothetical protein
VKSAWKDAREGRARKNAQANTVRTRTCAHHHLSVRGRGEYDRRL